MAVVVKLLYGEGCTLKGVTEMIGLHSEVYRVMWLQVGCGPQLCIDGTSEGGGEFFTQIILLSVPGFDLEWRETFPCATRYAIVGKIPLG